MNKYIEIGYMFALPLFVIAGVCYGVVSYYWGSPWYLMCLAPYGIFVGLLWHPSAFPLAAVSMTALAGAISFPVHYAFC